MKYFILQLETGLIDGWYTETNSLEELEVIRDRWNKKIPDKTHLLCSTKDKGGYIDNSRFLPRNY